MVSTLVFIDAAIDRYELLANGVCDATIVKLDSAQDGVTQISAALSAAPNLESVHIFSHGAPGTLQLGSSFLNLDTIAAYDLQPWQQALKHANLLIYGCRVAAGEVGDRFLQELQQRTGANNIAATATPTGSTAKGGDWNLERTIGAVDQTSVLRSEVMAQYDSTLALALPNLLYGVSRQPEQPSELSVIVANGSAEDGRRISIGTLAFQTFALAREAQTGNLYYVENVPNGRVAYFDIRTGQNVELPNSTGTGFQDEEAPTPLFVKLAQQSGTNLLFAMTSSTSILYVIETEGEDAGVARAVAALGQEGEDGLTSIPFGSGDIAFDPTNPNRLFVTSTRPDDNNIDQFDLYQVDISPIFAPFDPDSPGSFFIPTTFVGSVRLPNGTPLSDIGAGSLAFGQDGSLYLTSDVDGNPETIGSRLYRINPQTAIVEDADRVIAIDRFDDFASLPTPTSQIDLVLTKTDGQQSIAPGDPIAYTITVTNTSTTSDLANIRLTDVIQNIEGATWSATFSGGVPGTSSFLPGAQSGTGNIDVRFNLGAQAIVTYTIRGTVSSTLAIGSTLSNTATIEVPNGVIDPDPSNNTATDLTTISRTQSREPVPPREPVQPGEPDRNGNLGDECVPGINRRGNSRNNRLMGDRGINRLVGGGGHDVLRGFDCPDLLRGGAGNDRLFGGTGNDRLEGNQGRDQLRGGEGSDRLMGRQSDDRLIGNRGNDLLRGNLGRDRLSGRRGSDRLDGGRGNDVLFGGSGQDNLSGGLGSDRLMAGSGDDCLSGQANGDRLFGRGGRDQLLGQGGADWLVGGTQADRLNGGLGVDRLRGGGGNDRLIGGRLADRLTGGRGRDRFDYRSIDEGGDRITDFSAADDRIDLSRIFAGSSRPGRFQLEQTGRDTTVLVDGNGDRAGGFEAFIVLSGVNANRLSARNFVI